MRNWWFSLVLLIIYLATFHLWMWQPDRRFVIGSGIGVFVLMLIALRVWRAYFVSAWDWAFHIVLAIDILLEALLILHHDHYGFYLCAAAFTATLGGYRAWALRRRTVTETEDATELQV